MIAPASAADPLDRVDLVVDQDAEPTDLDRFLDAVEAALLERAQQAQGVNGAQ